MLISEPAADKSDGQRVSVRLPLATYRRLAVHCIMRNQTLGDVLTALVEENLTQWEVRDAVRPGQPVATEKKKKGGRKRVEVEPG